MVNELEWKRSESATRLRQVTDAVKLRQELRETLTKIKIENAQLATIKSVEKWIPVAYKEVATFITVMKKDMDYCLATDGSMHERIVKVPLWRV